jgi:hypothetical protein
MRIAIISDLTKWKRAGCKELWGALACRALQSGHKAGVFPGCDGTPPHKAQPLLDLGFESAMGMRAHGTIFKLLAEVVGESVGLGPDARVELPATAAGKR